MAQDTPPRGTLLRNLPLIALVLVAALGTLMLRDALSFETLRTHREALIAYRDAHYLMAVAGFVALYVGIVAFSLPGATVATLAGGFLFGVFPGVLYNVIAATLGACAVFLVVRQGLGDRLAARIDAGSGAVRRIRDGLRDNELSVLFLMRLVPAVPFFAANLIPALMGVGLARFAVTTFLGIIPGALVFTWVGAGLGAVFQRGETPDLGLLFEPQVFGPILGLCLLAALPILIRLWRKAAQ